MIKCAVQSELKDSKEVILQYLCFSGDLDEKVHVLIPNQGHVVFSWDNDIKHQVKGVLFHFVLYTRIFPRNSKSFISQYDCQILEENLSGSYNVSSFSIFLTEVQMLWYYSRKSVFFDWAIHCRVNFKISWLLHTQESWRMKHNIRIKKTQTNNCGISY